LARLLRMTKAELQQIEDVIKYYSFSKEKKDGNERVITAPENELKKIQRRVLNLLANVKRPDWLISGERGKSYIDNGKTHQNSDYFLTVDVRKFYDNCKRGQVYKFFTAIMCVERDIACILTDITTFEGKVPTGCPSSQLLAYYAYQDMFMGINKLAQKHGCIFTLYVDDMTFSSNEPFNPKLLSNEIDIVLRKFGHRPKYGKVKYYSKDKFKIVTGVVISKEHELLVANNLRKKIYEGAIKLKTLQGNFDVIHIGIKDKKLRSLRGQLQAARSVNKTIFPEINRLVDNETNLMNLYIKKA
jgi:RNA-directed DNA polymerase